eukprot:TCALIF_12090-PA protein Name:"Protein of unknown function" AED:0.56 eAED:0.56 QI:22/0.5/0.66/0.66/0.5/0.66/3/0/226
MVAFDISLQGSEYESKWSLRKGQYLLSLDKQGFIFSCPAKSVSIVKTLVKKSGTRQKSRKEGDYYFLQFGESCPRGSGVIRIFSSQVYEIAAAVEFMLKHNQPKPKASQTLDRDNKRVHVQSMKAQPQTVGAEHSSSEKGMFKWIHSAWKKISSKKTKEPPTSMPNTPLPIRRDSLEPEEAYEPGSNSDCNYEYEYVYEYCAPVIDRSLKWHKNSAAATEYCEDIL